MDSSKLLPALSKLPKGDHTYQDRRKAIEQLLKTDPLILASELAAAGSIATWGIWDQINVPDELGEAYAAQYPNLAEETSLHEHWDSLQENGEEAVTGFLSGLKGKMAEIKSIELLKKEGYTNVEIADSPNQPTWDISAISPSGEEMYFQVKTGAEDYAGEVATKIAESSDIHFLLGSEIYNKILPNATDEAGRIMDIGPDYELVDGALDGLETLSANEGIDVIDGIADAVPLAGVVWAGCRLIYGAIKAEREFREEERKTKNKIQVLQALTLMSRLGVNTVIFTICVGGGAASGSVVPGIGTTAGGVVGSVVAIPVALKLNKHLKPRMLDMGLSITGLVHDDLFYFKNKRRILRLAESYRRDSEDLGSSDFDGQFA